VKYLYFCFFGLILLASCTNSREDKLLSEDLYEKIFIELAIIDQIEEALLGDHSRSDLRQMVYEHYGVTAEKFNRSHNYYEQDIDEQIRRIESIHERLRDERSAIDETEREIRDRNRRTPESLREQILGRGEDAYEAAHETPAANIPEPAQTERAELPVTTEIEQESKIFENPEDFAFSDDGIYAIQVRSEQNFTLAKKLKEEWIEKGFVDTYLQEFEDAESGETWYRIRLGNINTFQEAERIQQAILEQYETEVWIDDLRVSFEQSDYSELFQELPFSIDGKYAIQVQSELNFSLAERVKERWLHRGAINTYLREFIDSDGGKTWYRIRLGNVDSYQDSKNIKNTIVKIFDTEIWIAFNE